MAGMRLEERHRVALLVILSVFYVGLIVVFAVGGVPGMALSTALIGLVVLVPMALRQRQRAARRPPVTSSV